MGLKWLKCSLTILLFKCRIRQDIMALDLHGFLNPNDTVAISFWIVSISMVAATVFFLMESTAVSGHWKTSMNVGALVPWRCLGGLRWWHVRMVLHPLRDLRWRGRICCWRAWISQQVHPGLVQHHASHCHCRLVNLPGRLLLWLPHGWCQ